jgi:hypothetical protein
VFGVPSMVVDGQVLWGQDALPMLRQSVQDAPWFRSDGWHQAADLPVGASRK